MRLVCVERNNLKGKEALHVPPGIGTDAGLHPDIPSRLPLAALQEHLSAAEILATCRELNHVWRDRKLPPPRMVRTMVYRSLHPDRSIAAVLAQWYRQRWPIETRIGSIKTTLQLNVLRSKTALGARSEVAATILAHNLVWRVIHQAAQQERVPADRVSFAGAVKLILAFSHPLRLARGLERENLYRRLLQRIASALNRDRPNRVEPRRIKRNPLRYPFLKEPRWKARLKCLS